MSPTRSLTVLLLSALLLPTALAAGDIPEFAPGPHGVATADWDFGQIQVSHPFVGTDPLTVNHFGTAAFPAGLGDAPYPLVVFGHGRFQTAPFTGHNHEQASYLIEHLASWGFVVVSVNLDVVGQFGSPAAIDQRGEIINATVAAFLALDTEGGFFDERGVALLGHSRGGEGAVAAALNNTSGAIIAAIGTIAPTDFDDRFLVDVPYLGIYGSKDGDVNNGWPNKIYDKAAGAEKVYEYVHGANHFWFTDSLNFSLEGSPLITREQHHDVARTYFAAFLRRVYSDQPFADLWDDPSLAPVTDAIDILPSYHRPGGFVVNDFEQWPIEPSMNTLGLGSFGSNLQVMDEQSMQMPALTFYHKTKAGWLEHDLPEKGGLAFYVEELPTSSDVSSYPFFSVRVCQRHGSDLNTQNEPQDFTVALVDERGHVAQVALSDHGTIPWPLVHSGFFFPSKSVMRTTRIPLDAFLADNPALDLTDLAYVALVLDKTSSSDLRVDDIEFTD